MASTTTVSPTVSPDVPPAMILRIVPACLTCCGCDTSMLHPSADSVNRLWQACHTLAGYCAHMALLPRARTCAHGPIHGTYAMPYTPPVHARACLPHTHPIAMHLCMHP